MDTVRRKKSSLNAMAQRKNSHLDNIDRFILEQLAERSWHIEYESDPEGTEWNELCFDESVATPFFRNNSHAFFERSEALEIGQELIDRHVGQQTSKEAGMTFSPDRYYQLVEDDENKPLNAVPKGEDEEEKKQSIPVAECNEKFIKLIKPIFNGILTDNNQSIIYGGLSTNDNFIRYMQFARELNQVTFEGSTPDDRLTFFINIYNMMLIHITLKHGPPIGIWQRRKASHRYALHSIINGILRANKKGPGMLWKAFGKQDERLPISLPVCDPLIYFALCSGSKTTPPLRVYHPKTIHYEMRENARLALVRSDKFLRVDVKKNVIHLGKTFKWFSDDFGGTNERILQWILDVLDNDESDKKNNLQKLFFTGEYSVEYIPYDWSTNGRMDEKEKEETEPEKND
ncbi:hypothetical protein CAEBREN_04810 [Caenorhabditis brenneri]|uniref:DUF547 domain-containing protein n=1 Tax=Caenorhabditis brenneri TaxID=135651 RepID=G0NTI2_CAEBE|nr:hypothetical protein CAEBREN_04810 [Caenorhabditis brenneri]